MTHFKTPEDRKKDEMLDAKLLLLHRCHVQAEIPSLKDFDEMYPALSHLKKLYEKFLESEKNIKKAGDGQKNESYTSTPAYQQLLEQLRQDLFES